MNTPPENVDHINNLRQYNSLVRKIMTKGENVQDRTGAGTRRIMCPTLDFNIRDTIPALSSKKVPVVGAYRELLWFISGSTNINDLCPTVHAWWKPWANEDGDLGPLYGAQWRNFGGTGLDQLAEFIHSLKTNPQSRRHIMTTWCANKIPEMGLPPCHGLILQGLVSNDGELTLSMYQRSADVFIGLPVNIVSYTMLSYMIGQVTGLKPARLVINVGDAHIYNPHKEAVKQYLDRPDIDCAPKIVMNKECTSIDDFTKKDLKVEGYEHHPALFGELIV